MQLYARVWGWFPWFFKWWIRQNFLPCFWVNITVIKSTSCDKGHDILKVLTNRDPCLSRSFTTLEGMCDLILSNGSISCGFAAFISRSILYFYFGTRQTWAKTLFSGEVLVECSWTNFVTSRYSIYSTSDWLNIRPNFVMFSYTKIILPICCNCTCQTFRRKTFAFRSVVFVEISFRYIWCCISTCVLVPFFSASVRSQSQCRLDLRWLQECVSNNTQVATAY